MSALSRSLSTLLVAIAVGLGAGCAAPEPEPTPLASTEAASATDAPRATAPAAPAPSAPTTRTRPAPPMSDPLPPQQVPEPGAGGTSIGAPAAGADGVANIDRSCRTNADCAVKNVGSCCGYMPACVNTNARPDPQAVQAQCAKQGVSSVCGFQEISSCQCVDGQCAPDGAGAALR